ncbi:MAG: hypothetical protein U0V75_11005 [Ferruginibacter sp.]
MKYLLFVITLIVAGQQANAQQITGLWYNTDSSRIYEIRPAGSGQYEAILKKSARKTDSSGVTVIKTLRYNAKKKRYEGIMYAAGSSDACIVKIIPSQNSLTLKLSRMYLFNVILRWNHAEEDGLTSSAPVM